MCYPSITGRLLTRYSPVRHEVTQSSNPKAFRLCDSFDLNVLCTPPAFILSQDQTLCKLYIQPTLPPTQYLPLTEWSSLYYFKSSFLIQKNLRSRISTVILLPWYTSSCCSIFNERRCRPSLGGQLFYIITSLSPLSTLFFSFSKIFLSFFDRPVLTAKKDEKSLKISNVRTFLSVDKNDFFL